VFREVNTSDQFPSSSAAEAISGYEAAHVGLAPENSLRLRSGGGIRSRMVLVTGSEQKPCVMSSSFWAWSR
jgi:hypothetical protein